MYGFITSLFLPYLFHDKLSIHLLKNKSIKKEDENLKKAYDDSKDISGMSKVLRKIFSFERYAFISNQIDAY